MVLMTLFLFHSQNVINQFHALASDGKCNFIGNIDVGSTVTVQFLKERYHAVVLVSACAHVLAGTVSHGVLFVLRTLCCDVQLESGAAVLPSHHRPMGQQRTAHWMYLER